MPRRAFSLVELSIVLVILGLLVGGVLTGRELIKSAALKKDVNFVEQTRSMAMAFRDKYFQLPGDMNNASQFWGLIADCTTNTGVYDQVCNGNGDGRVMTYNSGVANGDQLELAEFYHHLSRAGLLNKRVSYLENGSAWPIWYLPGSAAFANSYFFVFWAGDNGYLAGSWGAWGTAISGLRNRQKHYIGITADSKFPNGSATNYGTAAPTEEVYALDVKYDDGLPMQGKILGHNIYGTSTTPANSRCITSFTPSAATYDLNGSNCNIYFEAGF